MEQLIVNGAKSDQRLNFLKKESWIYTVEMLWLWSGLNHIFRTQFHQQRRIQKAKNKLVGKYTESMQSLKIESFCKSVAIGSKLRIIMKPFKCFTFPTWIRIEG